MQTIVDKLSNHNQQHLIRWWDDLDQPERQSLKEQIESVDFELIERLLDQQRAGRQTSTADSPAERAQRARPPAELVRLPRSADDQTSWSEAVRCGMELLSAGKVGVILVAGGQGTRLGFPKPKGMYPIGPVSECSLFQILAEQVLARSRQALAAVPYYIMTSDATHSETVAFFEEHNNFGLNADDVFFFQQGNMPAVDAATGRLLLAGKGRLCSSPDGHGGMLAALAAAGLLDDMKQRGVQVLYYHQVDNPTAKVCDPAFLGFHTLRNSEMSTKVVAKRSPDEPMGLVVDVDGRTQIVEYMHVPDEVASQTDERGDLLLWAGSTAIHVFDRAFLERLVADKQTLPFQVAHKRVPYLDDSGQTVDPDEPNAWKFERFIFDALPAARHALVVEADRGREFNPVKNAQGSDTPDTAKAAMCALFADWLKAAGAKLTDDAQVEISPLFALDADDVRDKVSPGTEYSGDVYLT